MRIVYMRLDVSLNGLDLKSEAEVDAVRQRILSLLEEYHPSGYSNIEHGDVVVHVVETGEDV